ncbi:MAG: metallo-beta-lactamase [Rhodoglobus sp.]|nr:metallo-beta-lactamase [Rhodoglobus sp.]
MSGYRLALPAIGAPAMSSTHGSLGWSSAALLISDARVVIIDTGGPGYRAMWDVWLAADGLTRFDVSLVLATHSHWDHIGAVDWFPHARIGIGADELAWAQGAAPADPYLAPELVSALARSPRVDRLENTDEVEGIQVVPTPGHTPGHLSFAVDTDRGRILVVGDAVKNGDELSGGAFAMTMDAPASESSRQTIRAAALDDGMSLLLGHDGLYSSRLERVVPPTPRVSTFASSAIVGETAS